MQVLFVWDSNGQASEELGHQVIDDMCADKALCSVSLNMAKAAWEGREIADKWVERLAPQWPPRRQPGVDRSILRLAVWELTGGQTPPKVVLDEAIELAKEYSTEQSAAFVNGVLDAVLKEHQALTGTAQTVQEPST